jgi:hypothetical protein
MNVVSLVMGKSRRDIAIPFRPLKKSFAPKSKSLKGKRNLNAVENPSRRSQGMTPRMRKMGMLIFGSKKVVFSTAMSKHGTRKRSLVRKKKKFWVRMPFQPLWFIH